MRPFIKRSNRTLSNPQFPQPSLYVPVKFKFVLGHCFAAAWLIFSIYISKAWVVSLGHIITIPLSIIVITGIAYIPSYMISFLVGSLLMDRQPSFKVEHPREPVTVLIAAWNEEKNIGATLRQLAKQDYEGVPEISLSGARSEGQEKQPGLYSVYYRLSNNDESCFDLWIYARAI